MGTKEKLNVTRMFHLEGYVLDADTLTSIDSAVKEAVSAGTADPVENLETNYSVDVRGELPVHFEALGDLLRHLDRLRVAPRVVKVKHSIPGHSRILVVFEDDGDISFIGFSHEDDFPFYTEKLAREIRSASPEYGWFVKRFIFNDRVSRWMYSGITGLSAGLAGTIFPSFTHDPWAQTLIQRSFQSDTNTLIKLPRPLDQKISQKSLMHYWSRNCKGLRIFMIYWVTFYIGWSLLWSRYSSSLCFCTRLNLLQDFIRRPLLHLGVRQSV